MIKRSAVDFKCRILFPPVLSAGSCNIVVAVGAAAEFSESRVRIKIPRLMGDTKGVSAAVKRNYTQEQNRVRRK